MQYLAAAIMERHAVMAVATIRPDGWPQVTMVNYVSEDLGLFFLISRTSQKFQNLLADDRVSIAIGSDAVRASDIEGLSLSGRAFECRDEPSHGRMLARLTARHPSYFTGATLDMRTSALFQAVPEVVSIVDYSKGPGHTDTIMIGAQDLVEMTARRADDWGPNPAHR
jgi:nitroimidazol reductase NimA-like FMN-containing flavoprotein (pyridoxamine 5'-phosphate oxidase superfamily)